MAKYFRSQISAGVATLVLDDPDAAVNTLSPAWIAEMTSLFEALRDDAAVSGVIVSSGKPGFMAGADLKYILDAQSRMNAADALAFSQLATALHRLIETIGKPVVAAINGYALGGGYELALACTRRIVSDNPKAVVGLPEVGVGLLPGAGGTQRLPRMIGIGRAAEVLLEGRSYPPTKALEMGLVDQVVPEATLLDAARAWLATMPDPVRPWDKKGFVVPGSEGLLDRDSASLFTMLTGKLLAKYGRNYPAPIAIASCLFEGMQAPFDKALLVESRYFAKLLIDPVARNMIRTSFVNRGLAERGARRPAGIPKAQVAKLGILGAGMMGAGIAFAAAGAGIDVVLLDTSLAAAEKGKAYSAAILEKNVDRRKMDRAKADAQLARIRCTTDYADLAGVDLVIEAVFEDSAIKADVTRRAEAVIGNHALFASNTSTLPISQLAAAFGRPADFIGLHFFSPVDKMALVEVIQGEQTGAAALARALDFVAQIGKVPIVVNDSRGFYTSRVFQTFIHEGMELLREGVSPALIENVARQAGMSVGPLAVLDEVTLELPMRIVRQSEREDSAYIRPDSMTVLETMVDRLGRPGRKGGGGFYEYPAGGKKHLWPGLSEQFPLAPAQPSPEEVRKRLLYVQAIETARCLEENVLTHPADGDVGAVLGWGFPAWSGGTLSLIETVGMADFVHECDSMAHRHGRRFLPTDQLRALAAEGKGFAWT